jgi:tRNA (guanine37-N1)-methyltransferase
MADNVEPVDTGSGRPPLEIDVLTLFPGMLAGPLAESIPGRAQTRGLATIRIHDLRQWGLGRHKTVDDYTYGGGAGMVLRPEVVAAALDVLRRPDSTVILPDPGGEVFAQPRAHDLAARSHLIILCPRYEGVDERIRSMIDLELSIGDYVLSGGEIPALVFVDTILRLLPGAIDAESIAEESFTAGLLEYPQYTRPPEWGGVTVPAILTSGHHEAVRKWRLKEALRRTAARRPELLQGRVLTKEEAKLMAELRSEAPAANRADEAPAVNRADEAPAPSDS